MVKDDVISDDKVWRVRFRPVAANSDYDALVADVRRVFTDEGKENLQ
jgi:hypothetical protein